ncbi:diguanylate cyclase domain-containing protein [Actinotalea sp.]|uniref:diguanylate cyclase domain-containing protein n=1 Tax=Actinotalea sp. TaxID=1872145 RepID=UPI003568C0F5
MHGSRQHAHVTVIALAVPLAALCLLGGAWRYGAITAAALVPLAALAVQLHRGTHPDRLGYTVMLAGTGVLAVHNVQNLVSFALVGTPAAGPAGAATLLLGYAVLLAGGLLVTVPYARRDSGGMLDAGLVGLAAASVVWSAVLYPVHLRLDSSAPTVVYEMTLVLCISALSGAVVRSAVVAPAARPAAVYLVLSITSVNLADIGSTLTTDPVLHMDAGWVGSLWVVAYVAFGAAIVHPSALAIAGPEARPRGLTRARLAFLGAALAVNPTVVGIQSLTGRPADVVLLSIGTLLMVPLVVTRIGLLAQWHADAARRLHDLASLDELTGLANRRAMSTHLSGVLERVGAGSVTGAVVLYLDLDDFKAVNDTYGHSTGDELLREVARRLLSCVRSSDLVARFGGDEFVVVLEGDPSAIESTVVPSIDRALSRPVDLDGIRATARASIGITSPVSAPTPSRCSLARTARCTRSSACVGPAVRRPRRPGPPLPPSAEGQRGASPGLTPTRWCPAACWSRRASPGSPRGPRW